jgi:hypothetical protein
MRFTRRTPVWQVVGIEPDAFLTDCFLVLCAYIAMIAAVLLDRVVMLRGSGEWTLPSFGWHLIAHSTTKSPF